MLVADGLRLSFGHCLYELGLFLCCSRMLMAWVVVYVALLYFTNYCIWIQKLFAIFSSQKPKDSFEQEHSKFKWMQYEYDLLKQIKTKISEHNLIITDTKKSKSCYP